MDKSLKSLTDKRSEEMKVCKTFVELIKLCFVALNLVQTTLV